MADNVTLNSMSGGVVVAADDVSSVFFQKIKLALGGDGVEGNIWDGKLVANSGVDIGDVTINNGSGASAVYIQDGGNSITVDGTVAITSSDISTIAGAIAGTEMQVDVITLPAVTNAGTFAVQSTNQANSGVDIGDVTINNASGASAVNIQDGGNTITVDGTVTVVQSTSGNLKAQVQGLVASGSADAMNPLKMGGRYNSSPITLDDADVGDLQLNSAGGLIVDLGGNNDVKSTPPDNDITTNSNYAKKYYTNAGAVTDGIIWSPAAGKRWHITSLYMQFSADCTFTLEDDKAGGDEAIMKGEVKAGSGVVEKFDKEYPLASGEDAADLIITTTAGNVYVTVVGYEV